MDPQDVLRSIQQSGAKSFLSEDGQTLTLRDSANNSTIAVMSATTPCLVQLSSSSCSYSLASLSELVSNPVFLAYRKACKKYDIKDPVKMTQREEVLLFLRGGLNNESQTQQQKLDEMEGEDMEESDDEDEMESTPTDTEKGIMAATPMTGPPLPPPPLPPPLPPLPPQQPPPPPSHPLTKTDTVDATVTTEDNRDRKSHRSKDDHRRRKSTSTSSATAIKDGGERPSSHGSSKTRRSKSSSSHHHRSSKEKHSSSHSSHRKREPKAPMLPTQLVKNLTTVVDKRQGTGVSAKPVLDNIASPTGKDRMMETTMKTESSTLGTVVTPNASKTSTSRTIADVTAPITEEERDAVISCLSSKGYEASKIAPDVLEADRALVAKIVANETPVGNSATVLRFDSANALSYIGAVATDGITGGGMGKHGVGGTNSFSKTFPRKSGSKHKHGSSSNKSGKGNNTNDDNKNNGKKDFTRILEMYIESINNPSPSISSPKAPRASKSLKRKRIPNGKPIIVVPNAQTSPLTLINALDFLQDAKFLPRHLALRDGRKRPNSIVPISRRVSSRLGGGTCEYEIVDNPVARFGKNSSGGDNSRNGGGGGDWDRVVAVIANGAAWQFKGWKMGGDGKESSSGNDRRSWGGSNNDGGSAVMKDSSPVEIFSKCFGYFISFEGAPIPADVKSWSVKKGVLSKDKRGLDSVVYAAFWNGLDEWMSVHKPEYLPSD